MYYRNCEGHVFQEQEMKKMQDALSVKRVWQQICSQNVLWVLCIQMQVMQMMKFRN